MNYLLKCFKLFAAIVFIFTYICLYIISDILPFLINKKIIRNTFKKMVIKMLNINIILHGNIKYLDDSQLLIMTNHYTGLDSYIINSIVNQYTHTIIKSNLVDECNKLFSLFFNYFIYTHYLVPYKRGDNDSGVFVKNKITYLLQEKKENVLIFPEGTSYRDGIPREFKNGIFHLVAEHNLTILPITLIYNKNIGLNKNDNLNLLAWVDITCDIYIHDKIQGTNYEDIKEKTFFIIKEPFVSNLITENIIPFNN